VITEESEVPQLVPQAPIGLWVENYQEGGILTWARNREMDIEGYHIYRSIDSLTSFIRLNSALCTDTLWIDTLGTSWPRFYYLTAVDSAGNESAASDTVVLGPVVGVGSEEPLRPFAFHIDPNYPNPFNPTTNIRFEVGHPGLVRLRVFDVLGRQVAALVDGFRSAGRYNVVWDAADVSSGVYFCRLESEGRSATMRMVMMR
jgi:hypothetical protein